MGLPTEVLEVEQPAEIPFDFVQGDTFYRCRQLTDEDGNAIDISGVTIEGEIAEDVAPGESGWSEALECGFAVVDGGPGDGTDGWFYWKSAASVTGALTALATGTLLGHGAVRFVQDGETRTMIYYEVRMSPRVDTV